MLKTEKLFAKELDREVTLYIYLPESYHSKKKFPVLYMHDGQNLFSSKTASYGHYWRIIESFKNFKLPEMIVIGIDCANGNGRLDEYSPYVNDSLEFTDRAVGGKGDIYLDYLVNTIKNKIDTEYSTLPDRLNTALMGSSMGGLITTYAAIKYNDYFSKYGCLSNAYWFKLDELLVDIKNNDMNDLKLYMDVGTLEGGNMVENNYYINTNDLVYNELKNKDLDLNYMVFKDMIHNEDEWSLRFPYIVKWLFRREQ